MIPAITPILPYYPAVIPADTYKNQTEELPTFATGTYLCCRADLGEELIYEMTKYMWENIEAASNHRYDTCDYCKIDPMLGTEQDFRLLCSEAAKRGIRVILDGVFNHSGDPMPGLTGIIVARVVLVTTPNRLAHWYSFSDDWHGARLAWLCQLAEAGLSVGKSGE